MEDSASDAELVFDHVTTAIAVAERILGRLQLPVSLSGGEIRVSSSIGIALFPDHATDEKTLLRHADTAMFRQGSRPQQLPVLRLTRSRRAAAQVQPLDFSSAVIGSRGSGLLKRYPCI